MRGIHRSPVNSPHVTRSFDVFSDLRLNKRLNKQSWGWWFETPSRAHHDVIVMERNDNLCFVICFVNLWSNDTSASLMWSRCLVSETSYAMLMISRCYTSVINLLRDINCVHATPCRCPSNRFFNNSPVVNYMVAFENNWLYIITIMRSYTQFQRTSRPTYLEHIFQKIYLNTGRKWSFRDTKHHKDNQSEILNIEACNSSVQFPSWDCRLGE